MIKNDCVPFIHEKEMLLFPIEEISFRLLEKNLINQRIKKINGSTSLPFEH